MKKLLNIAMLIIAVVTISACTEIGILDPEGDSTTNVAVDLTKDQDVIAVSALSSATLAPALTTVETNVSLPSSDTLLSFALLDGDDENRPRNHKDLTLEEITPYLSLFEKLLSESPLVVTNEVSDRELYEYKVVYTFKSLTDEDLSMTMYYNLTALDVADEITDEEPIDEGMPEEYTMDGVVIRDGEEYAIVGMKTIENDEEKFVFTTMIDELTYIRNSYKVEDGEQQFSIATFIDGVKVSEDKMKLEVSETETKFVLRSFEGADEQRYEFKLEDEDGVQILKVRYDVTLDGVRERGQARVLVVFDEVTQTYSYDIILKGDDDDEEREERVRRESEDNGENISFDALPLAVQDYITVNYPDAVIEEAELDDGLYEVEFTNDVKLYFDLDGNFVRMKVKEEREERGSEVDESMLPQEIFTYVVTEYPGLEIVKVKFDDGFFKVKLNGGIELYFDEAGNFAYSNLDDFEEHPGRGRGEKITVSDLPEVITTYINENYPDDIIDEIKLKSAGYTIEFVNDTKLIFDLDGNFVGVYVDEEDENDEDDYMNPDQLADVIKNYILENFPDASIVEIDIEDVGFEIKLSTGEELVFDFSGTFLFIDTEDVGEDADDEDSDTEEEEESETETDDEESTEDTESDPNEDLKVTDIDV